MRDYNAIQFRSPSDKHQQQQQQQQQQSPLLLPKLKQQQATTGSGTTISPYSTTGLILNTVRSTSLSPIPKSSSAPQPQPQASSSDDHLRLPFLPPPNRNTGNTGNSLNNDDDNQFIVDSSNSKKTQQLRPLPQQPLPQKASSIASTDVITNSTTLSGQYPNNNNNNNSSATNKSSSSLSPPQKNMTKKSYRSSSPVDNVLLTMSPITSSHNQPNQQPQQQQHSNAAVSMNESNNNNNSSNTIPPLSSSSSLSPTDALALRRDYNNNFELYIHKLRSEIQQQQTTIQKISTASSKSDAVILELRSTIRQYKRQLEKLQQSQQSQLQSTEKSAEAATNDKTDGGGNDTSLNSGTNGTTDNSQEPQQMRQQELQQQIPPPPTVAVMQELTGQVQELQHQLLTADLIRKELEDTIEAEQYTWELRVQDLEREVNELKQQQPTVVEQQPSTSQRSAVVTTDDGRTPTTTATSNISNEQEYRKQLEDAQNEIQRYRSIIMTTTTASDIDTPDDVNHMNVNSSLNTDESSLNTNNNNSTNILLWKEKVVLLEQERTELQGCLDEALKELEAVDLELQQEDATNTLRDENERLQIIIQQLQQQQQQQSAAAGAAAGQTQNGEGTQHQQQQRGLVLPDHDVTNDTTIVVVEQLQHLYRWLLERDGSDEGQQQSMRMMKQQYHTVDELIRVIQQHIDQEYTTIDHVQELERQISAHKGDIHAKEEETNEIRNSLKEAVSLLRPIQDSLTKLEKEKVKYQETLEGLQAQQDTNLIEIRKYKQLINDKDDEIDQMKQNIESMEIQLSKAKLAVANTVAAQHNLGNTSRSVFGDSNAAATATAANDTSFASPSEVLDEKRAKRRTGENALKELLRDAQLRGGEVGGGGGNDSTSERDQQLFQTIQEYEQEISLLRDELAKNDTAMERLQLDVTSAKDELLVLQQQQVNTSSTSDQTTNLQQAELRVQMLEGELQDTKRALALKRDAERSLNKSLKDALGLIKPLQIHLEESEMEKRQIAHELELLLKEQQQQEQRNISGFSRSVPNGPNNVITNSVSVEVVKDLETTVQQLEKENAMLQDALEDMSQSLNASHVSGVANARSSSNNVLSLKQHPSMNDSSTSTSKNNNTESTRLHQEFVELQSRYEVTQTRLTDAYHENNTLNELVQQEQDEKFMLHDEVVTLREQLLQHQQQQRKGTI